MQRTVYWNAGAVCMVDQNRLPAEEVEVRFTDWQDVVEAIRCMTVRGAPAIGAAAAYGLALASRDIPDESFSERFSEICETFAASRPTAVNLFWAIERMQQAAGVMKNSAGTERYARLLEQAERIAEDDITANRQIGRSGAELLPDGARVLTHCNAGALACVGYGTALGVFRAMIESGKTVKVYADETRPRLQGMKLTAYELMRDGIPVTVIPDNASGSLMREGLIDAIVVGADRIAANGDFANKIGTYNVAVLARHHGLPFYVAAPWSTIDTGTASGREIPIEMRNVTELTEIAGVRVAPEGVNVYNPAFDVTPAELITAIITERGVYQPPYHFPRKSHQQDKPC